MSYIEVDYKVYSTKFSISKQLNQLAKHSMLSFDTETRSVYSTDDIAEAKSLLKEPTELSNEDRILCSQVSRTSGLSYPSLIDVTHWLFGIDKHNTVILVTTDYKTELMVANWVANYKGVFLVHNSSFDFKIVYQRTNKIPENFIDTQLWSKCLVNHVEVYKAKTGLKELVGEYYPPAWSLYNDYNVPNLKDKKFLDYCAMDASGVWTLYKLLKENSEECDE